MCEDSWPGPQKSHEQPTSHLKGWDPCDAQLALSNYRNWCLRQTLKVFLPIDPCSPPLLILHRYLMITNIRKEQWSKLNPPKTHLDISCTWKSSICNLEKRKTLLRQFLLSNQFTLNTHGVPAHTPEVRWPSSLCHITSQPANLSAWSP